MTASRVSHSVSSNGCVPCLVKCRLKDSPPRVIPMSFALVATLPPPRAWGGRITTLSFGDTDDASTKASCQVYALQDIVPRRPTLAKDPQDVVVRLGAANGRVRPWPGWALRQPAPVSAAGSRAPARS